MAELDYLKKLQEAMMGEQAPIEETVTDPRLRDEYVSTPMEEGIADVGRSIASAETEPIVPEKDIEDVNNQAKSDYQKTGDELDADKKEMDPRAEYAKLIEDYRAKLAEPDKKREYGAMDWMSAAGQVADIFNTNRGFRSMGNKTWDDGSVEKAKAKKKEDLTGMQNLQKMYQNYIGMNKKGKEGKDIYKVGDDLVKYNPKTKKAESILAEGVKQEKPAKKTKLQEEKEKLTAKRYASLEEQMPERSANIQEARELIKLLKTDELDTGPGSALAGDIGSFIDTEESTYKQRLDSLAERAARAALKANGEVRPTDADVEGMKRAMFNLGNTEAANIKKLEDFIKQQESGIEEYTQMKDKLKSGEGLENFVLDRDYKKSIRKSKQEEMIERMKERNPDVSEERIIKALKHKGLM